MKLEYSVKVLKIGQKSSRGFYFKESTIDKYLESKEFNNRFKSQTSLGISTHYDRLDKSTTDNKVPIEDVVLLKKSITHVVTNLYKKNGYLMADIKFLNPELLVGEPKERVMFLLALLDAGVKLPTSAGIEAFYNPVTKEGEMIYDFVGLDFTLSPDFKSNII